MWNCSRVISPRSSIPSTVASASTSTSPSPSSFAVLKFCASTTSSCSARVRRIRVHMTGGNSGGPVVPKIPIASLYQAQRLACPPALAELGAGLQRQAPEDHRRRGRQQAEREIGRRHIMVQQRVAAEPGKG